VGKAGNGNTLARGRGFRASRRSEVAFMTGMGFVAEAAGLPFIISRPGPRYKLNIWEGENELGMRGSGQCNGLLS